MRYAEIAGYFFCMAKDPAFLFYPGDYLRDTQCLSERVQVAYDRIMCEHMRNICISQAQLNFFTKRLTEDEVAELKMVLTEISGGYQITWIAESIAARKAYSESRRNNRASKPEKKEPIISSTYDKHMENENEIVNEVKKETKKVIEIVYPFETTAFKGAWLLWKQYKKEQFNFAYKQIGEQAALKDLSNISGGNEQTAIKLIENAIAKNWKGIYKTNDKNGQSKFTYEDLLNAAADAGAIYPKS
mgnify:FL=1